MPKARAFLVYWLPVVIWMVLIFSASGDSQSFPRSSRIIGPFLHWLLPNLSDASIKAVVVAARKCAHLTEYAVLAFLVWRARGRPAWRERRPWQWRPAVEALWVTMFYAATDEFHQTFIPSREGCLRDVIIDSSGAVIGLILLRQAGKWFKRW